MAADTLSNKTRVARKVYTVISSREVSLVVQLRETRGN